MFGRHHLPGNATFGGSRGGYSDGSLLREGNQCLAIETAVFFRKLYGSRRDMNHNPAI